MNVFVANFGTGNWAWKDCLQRSTIAVMDDVRVHPFWQRGDLEGMLPKHNAYSRAEQEPLRSEV
jgi:hypothetical protein